MGGHGGAAEAPPEAIPVREWEAYDDRVEFAFWLYKGTYATTFLREFMKSDRLTDY